MDVLARRVEPAQGDLCQLWSKSIHGGNTLDSFVVDLGSALEDALVLLSTSTPTSTSTLEGSTVRSQKPEQESLESPDNAFDNDQSPQKVPSWSFHGSCENLISAMKGSRKEHGKDVGKLRVSWATDVYDPPITSQSHAVGSNHKQYSSSSRHRKNLKNNKNKAKLHRSSRKSKGSLSR